MCEYTYICEYMHTCICMPECKYTPKYIHTYIAVLYTHTHTHTRTRTHTHTHTNTHKRVSGAMHYVCEKLDARMVLIFELKNISSAALVSFAEVHVYVCIYVEHVFVNVSYINDTYVLYIRYLVFYSRSPRCARMSTHIQNVSV